MQLIILFETLNQICQICYHIVLIEVMFAFKKVKIKAVWLFWLSQAPQQCTWALLLLCAGSWFCVWFLWVPCCQANLNRPTNEPSPPGTFCSAAGLLRVAVSKSHTARKHTNTYTCHAKSNRRHTHGNTIPICINKLWHCIHVGHYWLYFCSGQFVLMAAGATDHWSTS